MMMIWSEAFLHQFGQGSCPHAEFDQLRSLQIGGAGNFHIQPQPVCRTISSLNSQILLLTSMVFLAAFRREDFARLIIALIQSEGRI